jgi:hypothetical protein
MLRASTASVKAERRCCWGANRRFEDRRCMEKVVHVGQEMKGTRVVRFTEFRNTSVPCNFAKSAVHWMQSPTQERL